MTMIIIKMLIIIITMTCVHLQYCEKKNNTRATLTINLHITYMIATITKISISGAVSKALFLVAFISDSSNASVSSYFVCLFCPFYLERLLR